MISKYCKIVMYVKEKDMKLVLVRHGESEWNKLNLFTGWTDVDLSEKGHEEAKEGGCEILIEDGPSAYTMAIEILEKHPRFKEVIINTELTDDGEDNH